MVFNSLQFLWFFAVVYALYRGAALLSPARAHRAQNWLLLIASYYFYAAWDYRFLALLAASRTRWPPAPATACFSRP